MNRVILQGIPMAPLWDICKGQFVGVLSALDFILILREVCQVQDYISPFYWHIFGSKALVVMVCITLKITWKG